MFLRGEYQNTRGSMSTWEPELHYEGDLPHLTGLDFSSVSGISNVSIRRYDLGIGTRYRSPAGYGVEVQFVRTNYKDRDPILEDETGTFNRFTAMVSKRF